ncbi:MAG TPA: hypothetical protein VLA72_19070 [Anaerolineales bacterium]|nr:hypothetical protein [Anaerolineales bacterium]
MQLPSNKRLIICLWTLPISGVVAIGALFLRKFIVLPGNDLGEWAQMVTSSSYLTAQYIYILAYILPFLGFWALYMYLSQHYLEKLAFWGLMGVILGTALPLTTLGVFSFASPAIGDLYLQGNTQSPQIITKIAFGPSMALAGLPGAFLYVGGCIAFGVAIWRSGVIPKWNGVLLALHGLFIAFGFGMPLLLVLSWVFLVTCGVWIISSIRKTTANIV